jgi:DNA-3-methyladenine glycosylase I
MQFTWPANDEQMLHYHDTEWGIPVHDDKKHFEFIVLDSFQAGLNWKTILHRRKHLQYFFYLFHLKSNELKLA